MTGDGLIIDRLGNHWQPIAACAVCGATRSRLLWRNDPHRYRFPTDMQTALVRCTSCGLIWVTPRVVALAVPEPGGRNTDRPAQGVVDTLLAQIARFKPPGRLLDLGCGYGDLVRAGIAAGWDAIGVEPRPVPARYARERLGVPVVQGYLEQAGFPPRSLDAVVMHEVLEHVADPLGMLRAVRDVLKDDGLLFLYTPDISSLEARLWRRRWPIIYVTSHYYFYSPRALRELLQRVGMRLHTRLLTYPRSVWWKDAAKWSAARLGIATHRLMAVIEKSAG